MGIEIIVRLLALLIAGLALALLARYIWSAFSGRDYLPLAWKQQCKAGLVPEGVKLLEAAFPDKVRFFNLWFQIHRLEQENIPGCFAELGVYKGETAQLLHLAAPQRQLYLFDTFEGFPAADLEGERGEAAEYTTKHFEDTSVEQVLKRTGKSPHIHIRKGYFPDTTIGLENLRFALVNLDADLYKPTLAGLHFFYPRLSPGGVILVHDHDERWPGLMQAVREFGQQVPEVFIPLPDMSSTVMLVRNRHIS
jgi:O-methyltransferase